MLIFYTEFNSEYNRKGFRVISSSRKKKRFFQIFAARGRQSSKKNILARFDLPVMAGVLISQLEKRKKVNIIKKGVSYLLIESDELVFKDILKFTSPCNLSKYLKQWQVT